MTEAVEQDSPTEQDLAIEAVRRAGQALVEYTYGEGYDLRSPHHQARNNGAVTHVIDALRIDADKRIVEIVPELLLTDDELKAIINAVLPFPLLEL